ncbi:PREDICTED: claudin-8-like [Nanorana parkeri]|uniref:claudin-8-like n=1 Tax=Nanorana parkeri TaxID=125878 RepID=UPI000854A10C|nr:PREDICTED: claudin-8-like [Nanorana parkeri]
MDKGALQIAGLVVCGIGLIGTCAVTGMPQWRVTAFIENNIIVFETLWEGLWMNCVRHANIRMQCKIYDSLLALTPDLQAGRALMCIAVCLSFVSFIIAIIGMKCTQCAGDSERTKGIILLVSGITFILSGIIVLIPVSWTANSIIRDFYNPLVNAAQKRELGDAIYMGWAAALALIAGGAILCCFCSPVERKYTYNMPAKTVSNTPRDGIIRKSSSLYSKSQYV